MDWDDICKTAKKIVDSTPAPPPVPDPAPAPTEDSK